MFISIFYGRISTQLHDNYINATYSRKRLSAV